MGMLLEMRWRRHVCKCITTIYITSAVALQRKLFREIHREQLSLERSMSDMDSAVGRLDNLLVSLYVVIAALIIAVALQAQLAALITGAGTLLLGMRIDILAFRIEIAHQILFLGLSWLIGGSLQEVLTCIIFLFVKHPFDVGDRIVILTNTYTVKEILLLSTIFLDAQGCIVQAPNVILNTSVRNIWV
jgi:small-conductance mechanosensitive channel